MSETIYWLIEGDEAKAKWQERLDECFRKRKEVKIWIERVGGTGEFLWTNCDQIVMAIKFESAPGKNWRKDHTQKGYYIPKRNLKEGKKLYAEMTLLEGGMGTESICDEFLGCSFVFFDGALRSCGWNTYAAGVVLKSKPSDRWKPIEGLRLLKDSEYWAIKEAEEK